MQEVHTKKEQLGLPSNKVLANEIQYELIDAGGWGLGGELSFWPLPFFLYSCLKLSRDQKRRTESNAKTATPASLSRRTNASAPYLQASW